MVAIILTITTVIYVDMPLWVKCLLVFALGVDIATALKNK